MIDISFVIGLFGICISGFPVFVCIDRKMQSHSYGVTLFFDLLTIGIAAGVTAAKFMHPAYALLVGIGTIVVGAIAGSLTGIGKLAIALLSSASWGYLLGSSMVFLGADLIWRNVIWGLYSVVLLTANFVLTGNEGANVRAEIKASILALKEHREPPEKESREAGDESR
jgi:hypothetical protein